MVGQALVGAAVAHVRRLPGARLPAGREGVCVRGIPVPGKAGARRKIGAKKRTFNSSATNGPVKMAGSAVITRCHDCPRFMITLCQETGRKIKYPISGGIDEQCPLPDAVRK